MGSVTFGVPKDEALLIRNSGLMTFVETGTYKMGTTLWAAANFPTVISIEADPERFAINQAIVKDMPNAPRLFRGDSGDLLPDIAAGLTEPALFWLDAHYMTGDPAAHECPVLAEIAGINQSPLADRHCILIDDARLFFYPPPPPANPDAWPRMVTVCKALNQIPGRQLIVKDDVIYAVPGSAVVPLMGYWKQRGIVHHQILDFGFD